MENVTDLSRNFLLNCDWLQIHVKENEDLMTKEQPFFTIVRTGQSKVFKNIYTIFDTATGGELATYTKDANECILAKNHGILKFHNAQLYIHDDLKVFVNTFLGKMNMQFVGFTRLDIAYDFQTFRNGLNPEEFIRMYIENKLIRSARHAKFSVYGEEGNATKKFQTLKIGSPKSSIKMKLYNKTKELSVNMKPYIDNLHQQTFEDIENINVWRLEFSIDNMNDLLSLENISYDELQRLKENYKGEKFNEQIKMINENEGKKMFTYNDLQTLEIQNLYAIFQNLFKKKFVFKIAGTATRTARMKSIELLLFDFPGCELHFIKQNPMSKESDRAMKILLKKMTKVSDEMATFDEDFKMKTGQLVDQIINKSVKEDFLKSVETIINDKELNVKEVIDFPEIFGKITNVYGLRLWAIRNGIYFTGYEKYIDAVYEVAKINFDEKMKQKMEIGVKSKYMISNIAARNFDRENLRQWNHYKSLV